MPTTTPQRRDQISAFYDANAIRIHATVRRNADAPEATIEDACQHAWTTLMRRPDITLDQRGLNWLTTTAIHAAWGLADTTDEIPAGSFQAGTPGEDNELPEPADPDDRSAEQRALAHIETRERFNAVKTLKPRERQALYLHGIGHSYAEIAELTNSTYTAVNRRITEARAALRRGGR